MRIQIDPGESIHQESHTENCHNGYTVTSLVYTALYRRQTQV